MFYLPSYENWLSFIKDICKICMEKELSVRKLREGPKKMPNIYTRMQAVTVKTR